ncbi:MAG TPA: D-amino acid aminotransferase [Thiobacillaceae bacterium]|nr:D-amino acid aminotransferase [Thiobacillaceae bacterium]HNU63804.1 D-amino acid aminotransferase [Thiobacillaceae bacterium]
MTRAGAANPIVCLNGEFLPLDQARVPVMDRGFLFGDGVYEVIPAYDRQPFRLAGHLRRLDRSLAGIRLANPHDDGKWAELVRAVIESAPWDDVGVLLQVTRGSGPREHAFPAQVMPTVFLMPLALQPPEQVAVARGVAAVTAQDNRWLRCDLKTISLLGNVLLRQLSVDAGCAETILLRDGWLTEGTASNVLIVRDGVLLTPPETPLLLPGITHEVVLELARAHGMAHATRPIHEDELRAADEIWITSSTKEVLAVTCLDGHPVGTGRPGPIFQRMLRVYREYKRAVMRAGRA